MDRRLLPKHELIAQADILSVDVPLSDSTFHLVNVQLLGQLKRGSLFLNTSRGPVIDQTALSAALESGHLGGAALDVYETEPLPTDSPLRRFDNVVLTPQMAAYSAEAWADLRAEMLDDHLLRARRWAPAIINAAVRPALRPV